MPIPKQDLRRCLIKKFGFEAVEGSKHEAVALFLDDHKVATTRFSRSQRDIPDTILGIIAREICVQLGDLKSMYGCSLSREDYLELLRRTDHLRAATGQT